MFWVAAKSLRQTQEQPLHPETAEDGWNRVRKAAQTPEETEPRRLREEQRMRMEYEILIKKKSVSAYLKQPG